jgi:hypothetical protein
VERSTLEVWEPQYLGSRRPGLGPAGWWSYTVLKSGTLRKVGGNGKGTSCVEDWMGDTLDVISKTWNYGTAVRSQERDCKVMHCHLLTIVSHLLRLEV